jgi:1-acyl-sn-glycerol-3-phosphate acyltransferase
MVSWIKTFTSRNLTGQYTPKPFQRQSALFPEKTFSKRCPPICQNPKPFAIISVNGRSFADSFQNCHVLAQNASPKGQLNPCFCVMVAYRGIARTPRENVMRKNALYHTAFAIVKAYSKLLLRMNMHFHEALPPGPKLFVANHPSAMDPILIHLLSHMSVMITANAFAFPVVGSFLRRIGQISVSPGGDALEQATALLRKGHSVGIFPEGTFSPQEGGFGQPRSGAARLALATAVPVVPVGIYLPRERSVRITSNLIGRQTTGYWYLSGPYAFTIGKPMQFFGDPENREHVRSATGTMMEWIQSLAAESEGRVRGLLPVAGSGAAPANSQK